MTTGTNAIGNSFTKLARVHGSVISPRRVSDGDNRVLPAQGFSLSELDDAGVDLDLAEALGLPVERGEWRLWSERDGAARFRAFFAPTAVIRYLPLFV